MVGEVVNQSQQITGAESIEDAKRIAFKQGIHDGDYVVETDDRTIWNTCYDYYRSPDFGTLVSRFRLVYLDSPKKHVGAPGWYWLDCDSAEYERVNKA